MVTEKDELEVLEGDEGEPEVGRHRDVGRQILGTPLSELKANAPLATLAPDATVGKAIETMKKKRVSAVMVVSKKKPRKLVGIFTERDFLDRALGVHGLGKMKLEKVMTRNPEALSAKDSVAYALNKMSVGRYRHIPVVDEQGVPTGMISARDLIDFIVELCPEEILNLPSDPKLAIPRQVDGG